MQLSKETQENLRRVTTNFGVDVATIIGNELAQRNTEAIQEAQTALGKLLNGSNGAGSKLAIAGFRGGHTSGRKSRGKVFHITEPAMQKLVGLIAKKGGAAEPKAVSKAFKLSPDQRRRFVAEAVKAGLVKVTGSRRTTRYVLAAKKGRKKTKAKKKVVRRKTTRRKAARRR